MTTSLFEKQKGFPSGLPKLMNGAINQTTLPHGVDASNYSREFYCKLFDFIPFRKASF
jgi:hypothetical protein